MTADLFSLAHARQLRDEGMERASRSPDSASWLWEARQAAWIYAAKHGAVSADDVLKIVPRPEWVSVNATGSLFKDKRFKLVGYKQSTKTSAHARRIGIYELNEESK